METAFIYDDVPRCASRFTGKERDTETGLDYFGARYYGSNMGRFTSPDAPFADQHVLNPQSWNLYSYARNNPLRYVDPDGRWIPPDHYEIIDVVFAASSAQFRAQLVAANDWVDSAPNQTAANSFMHGMRDGTLEMETTFMARQAMNDFVDTHLEAAVAEQLAYEQGGGKGDSSSAAYEFGLALHPTVDQYSPEHAFQPWSGGRGEARRHGWNEYWAPVLHPSAMRAAQDAARRLWAQYQQRLQAAREKQKQDEERRKREEEERKKKQDPK